MKVLTWNVNKAGKSRRELWEMLVPDGLPARQRFRMLLSVLQLWHGRRSAGTAPGHAAVAGSDPPSRGLGAGSGRVSFRNSAPAFQGSLPQKIISGGKAVRRR